MKSLIHKWPLAVLMLVAAWFPLAANAADTKIRVGVIKIQNHVPLYAADKLGYFKNAGIELEMVFVRSGAEGQAGVISGSIEFVGVNSVSFLHGRAQNLPIVAVADGGKAPLKAPAAYAIITRSDGSVSAPKDLEGKVVGVVSRKSLQELHFYQWAKLKQIDPAKVRFVELGFAQMQDAVMSKQIDAALILEPFVTRATEDSRIKLLSYFSVEAEPGHAATMWVGNEPWIKSHADATKKFVDAIYRAHEYLNKNPEEAIKLAAEYTGLDAALLKKVVADVLPMDLDPTSLERQAVAMKELNWVEKPIDVKSGIWTGK